MQTTLPATARSAEIGKGAARKLRSTGQVPAVVYGPKGDPVSITVDPKTLLDIFRKSKDRNSIIELDIGGEKVPTLVRDVQRHPVSRDVLHVDFYRVHPEVPVTVDVPLAPFGKMVGSVLGGQLRVIRRTVKVRCRYDLIPDALPHDVSPLDIGDMVKISQIKAPEGSEILFDHDINVLSCFGKRVRVDKKAATKDTKKKK